MKAKKKTEQTVTILLQEDARERDTLIEQLLSDDMKGIRISVDAVRRILNPFFERDADVIAYAGCVNMLRNALKDGRNVVLDIGSAVPLRYRILEAEAVRAGAAVIHVN